MVRNSKDQLLHRISLSSLVIPRRLGRADGTDEPWSWEAHEFLRQRLRGKPVRVRFDYLRPAIKTERTNLPEKTFYSIFIGQSNIAQLLIEQGLASLANHSDNEPRSPDYQELVLAEADAKKARRGIHGNPKNFPIHRVNDLTRSLTTTTTTTSSSS